MNPKMEPGEKLPWLVKKALVVIPLKDREDFEVELRCYYDEHCPDNTSVWARSAWLHYQGARAIWYQTPEHVRRIIKTVFWVVTRWWLSR